MTEARTIVTGGGVMVALETQSNEILNLIEVLPSSANIVRKSL